MEERARGEGLEGQFAQTGTQSYIHIPRQRE